MKDKMPQQEIVPNRRIVFKKKKSSAGPGGSGLRRGQRIK